MSFFSHPSAIVEDGAQIGAGTKIWHFAHIRRGSIIGRDCTLGKGVYVDSTVSLGDRVKVQNNVSIYAGVTLADGVFVGPHACFTNDLFPRAITPDGELAQLGADWELSQTVVESGASIGANATIVAGITLGKWCLIGAGAVVTRNIPPYALAYGNPARVRGVVGPSGRVIAPLYESGVYQDHPIRVRVEILPEWCGSGFCNDG
jgi:acetyltransferase-like isoleucine patch superfamily enzyme